MLLDHNTVYVRRGATDYTGRAPAPTAEVLLERLFADAGLDAAHHGTRDWNPLSHVIRPGDRVVLKPNWVLHENLSGGSFECLVTHTSVLEAILKYVLKAQPADVVLGDAPIQGCDFSALNDRAGLGEMAGRLTDSGAPISIRDFRMVRRTATRFDADAVRTARGADEFVEFDLGRRSWLEPITQDETEFRVTMYDPDALARTHAPGMHRYLVAREVIAADVIINVPKLKTHKKAGLTAALKNAVGINGLKDYLPHHRKGGSASGGDCYAGGAWLKSLAEDCLDAGNRSRSRWAKRLFGMASAASLRLNGGDRNLEGSWFGNDTIWRMTLDLQTLLACGRLDGTIAGTPQRRVLHITDGIVAGDGDGPLYPSAVPLGVMTLASDAGAADWIHALILGYDPERIPTVRHALPGRRAGVLRIRLNGAPMGCDEFSDQDWPAFEPPAGWRNYCERKAAARC